MISIYLHDGNVKYSDDEEHFRKAEQWATNNCQSFLGMKVEDVSDFSVYYDSVGEYRFEDEKDAMMFRLKFI